MPLEGRGSEYSRTRAAIEWSVAQAMRGGWAPRLLKRVGLQPRVVTCEHRIHCARWPREAPPLRIGFVSDLHAGPTTHPSLHREAIDALKAAKPDVLLLGGDFVFLRARYFDALETLLAELAPPLGGFAVMGNHDLWADDRHITRGIERAGFEVLVNENRPLPAPFAHVSVCGLDDPWVGSPDVAATFAGARDVRVLLMHAPEGLLKLGDTPFDLAMCGHTHGGHIALPGGIPIVSAGPLSKTYVAGLYDIGGRPLVVSRGIGATESPLRLFADPDVRIVTFGQ